MTEINDTDNRRPGVLAKERERQAKHEREGTTDPSRANAQRHLDLIHKGDVREGWAPEESEEAHDDL